MAEAQLDLGKRMACDSSVQVGDWVYIRAADSKAALADSSDLTKMPSVGFVTHKQGADLCFVKNEGIYTRPPETYTPGDEVFISDTQPGRLVIGAPTGAAVQQKAGDADPDGVSIIVALELKDVANVTLAAGGEVVRPFAAGLAVGDVVYHRSDGVVDFASATSESTMRGRAVISSLNDPSAGLAKVQYAGDLAAYSGLTIGETYIAGQSPGSIVGETDTANPDYPDQTNGSGHIRAEIGVASSPTTLLIGTLRDFDEF